MERKTIETRVREAVWQHAPEVIEAGDISADSRLGADLGMDSLDEVEFVIQLEEEFGVQISDEDAERMLNGGEGTVGGVVSYIAGRLSEDLNGRSS